MIVLADNLFIFCEIYAFMFTQIVVNTVHYLFWENDFDEFS